MAQSTSSSQRLKDRIAVVTGASSGIGRAISLAYSREGAKVVVSDIADKSRNPAEADVSTVDLIKKNGGTAEFIKADVTDSASIESLIDQVVQKYGRLDIMVNNAGVATEAGEPEPIWAAKDSTWNRNMSINCTGVFNCLRAASRQMIKQEPHPNGDRGWIVNLASVFSYVGIPGAISYVASKHLVMGLTRAAALDLAPYRVHCNAINPGYTKSAFTAKLWEDEQLTAHVTAEHPFRGVGTPEDAAGIAVFLASDDAKWVTGQGIVSDGGYTAH